MIELQPSPVTALALCVVCTRPSRGINYQPRAHCCVLSQPGTRTRQTGRHWHFWGRSSLKEQKQMRVTPHESLWYNMRSTADASTKVIVSQWRAALWCFVSRTLRSLRAWWSYAEHTQAAWIHILDLDTCCRCMSARGGGEKTDPSWSHPTLDTERLSESRLRRTSVCLCFVGSQWGYIHLQTCLCVEKTLGYEVEAVM